MMVSLCVDPVTSGPSYRVELARSCSAMSTRMVLLHLPHTVPAPHASPTACSDVAPPSMASRMAVLLIASHKQTHTPKG